MNQKATAYNVDFAADSKYENPAVDHKHIKMKELCYCCSIQFVLSRLKQIPQAKVISALHLHDVEIKEDAIIVATHMTNVVLAGKARFFVLTSQTKNIKLGEYTTAEILIEPIDHRMRIGVTECGKSSDLSLVFGGDPMTKFTLNNGEKEFTSKELSNHWMTNCINRVCQPVGGPPFFSGPDHEENVTPGGN